MRYKFFVQWGSNIDNLKKKKKDISARLKIDGISLDSVFRIKLLKKGQFIIIFIKQFMNDNLMN